MAGVPQKRGVQTATSNAAAVTMPDGALNLASDAPPSYDDVAKMSNDGSSTIGNDANNDDGASTVGSADPHSETAVVRLQMPPAQPIQMATVAPERRESTGASWRETFWCGSRIETCGVTIQGPHLILILAFILVAFVLMVWKWVSTP